MSEEIETRVLLERIAGDVRLIGERQIQQQKDMARIEDAHKSDIRDVRERLHRHSDRLGNLEALNQMRKGAMATASALGGAVVAIIGLVARLSGVV